MNPLEIVNTQPLNMVRDELVATIDESARHLEVFVNAQDDGESLQSCIEGIKQIIGILKLLQFHCAVMLTEELLSVANEITPGESNKTLDRRLEGISGTFFVLVRYLEYIQQVEYRVPVLLLPSINVLKRLRGEVALSESHFFPVTFPENFESPDIEPYKIGEEPFGSVVRRTRHMYQVALLSLIRNRQVKNSLKMVRRALIRLQQLGSADKPLTLLWWLGNEAISAMLDSHMEVTPTRTQLLSRLDRVIRQLQNAGDAALLSDPPKGLIKELVYLITLSRVESAEAERIRSAFKVQALPYTDQELTRERDALNGPSLQTIHSLAKVLRAELSSTKKVLEGASQSGHYQIDDLAGFISTLKNIAETLHVVGLRSASDALKADILVVSKWDEKDNKPDSIDLDQVANTLLFVESTAAGLERSKVSGLVAHNGDGRERHEIIASNEVQEALRIVIEECEAGLSLTKRALSSFSESHYDNGHIRNIAKTLNSVRGGFIMLNKNRAAGIVAECVGFVDEVLMGMEPPAALSELLEMFADVIISVEYYLDSVTSSFDMNEAVLLVAEESLEAIKLSVEG